jgi:ATP-dependent Clp protease ATP-binding subunit ClpC
MATLHVRNVPDELYERLRSQAAASGRSIGAEVVQLLEERLVRSLPLPHGRLVLPGLRRGRRSGTGFLTRFTPAARQVVVEAQEQARGLGYGNVGTEHLVLGLLRCEADDPARVALETLGVEFERARAEVEQGAPESGEPAGVQLPFRPEAKRALELALRDALALRDGVIAPVHLLLGVVAAADGAGAALVRAVEPDVAKVRACILRAREDKPGSSWGEFPRFAVVELEGRAEDWERQLNLVAARGYELEEIVGKRAVFRAAPQA